MKKMLILLVGMALAFAALVIPASPASAHDYDNYSALYCEYHKQFSYELRLHSSPIHMDPDIVIYACKFSNPNTGTYTQDVWVDVHTGYSVWTNYQDCSTGCESVP